MTPDLKELAAVKADRDDWKARALKAEQAGEVMAWGMPDALGNIVESISPTEKVTDFKAWAAQYSIPLYATPPSAVPVVEQLVEASTMLLSYTLACEGLLNAKPAGQIDIAQEAIAAGQKFIKENGK